MLIFALSAESLALGRAILIYAMIIYAVAFSDLRFVEGVI
jgi:hypothetical protein